MGRQSPKNTALARKLARLWEKWTGDDFPGGVENAFIQRDYPGRQQRAQGAMSWALYTMGPGTPAPILPAFMSQWPATLCAKKPEWIQTEGDWGSIWWPFEGAPLKNCAGCGIEAVLTRLSDGGYYCRDCVLADQTATSEVPDTPGRKGTRVRCPACGEWAHEHDETTRCFLYVRFLDDEQDDLRNR